MSKIELPQLRLKNSLVTLGLGAIGVAISTAAFLLPDASLRSRVAVFTIVASIVGALTVLYFVRFVVWWGHAVGRRVLAYDGLLQSIHHEQRERAEVETRIALALGVTRLPVSKLIKDGEAIKLVVPLRRGVDVHLSDVLLLVDERGPQARARVDFVNGAKAEASLTWYSDPLARGWFVKNITPLGLPVPPGTVVYSVSSMRRKLEQYAHQLGEEEGRDG